MNRSLIIHGSDRHEIQAGKAGAADEYSVDVLHRRQFCGVRRRHGSPVKNAYGRPLSRQELLEIGADERMRFGNVAERGRDAGANSPDWFVTPRRTARSRERYPASIFVCRPSFREVQRLDTLCAYICVWCASPGVTTK